MPPKPRALYHGSSITGLKIITPQNKSIRDLSEGPVVFGTPSLAFSCMFLSPRPNDSWSCKGSFNSTYYMVISDEQRFREGDKGGIIYELPSDTFYQDLTKGMRSEWISKEDVPVRKEFDYPSTLDAMIENGVQVYFVDQETFQKIRTSDDHGYSIMKNSTSENMKRGKNVREF